jgi:hypothetical protein
MAKGLDGDREIKRVQRPLTRDEDYLHYRNMGALAEGHQIYQAMQRDLNALDSALWFRTKAQRIMHQRMIAGLVGVVYKDLVRTHAREIMMQNGFDSLNQEILLTMPRRGGKTAAVVTGIMVIMENVPNVDIVLIAPSSRAAGNDSGFMEQLKTAFAKFYNRTKFDKHGAEVLKIEKSPTDIRRFKAYPGGATHK